MHRKWDARVSARTDHDMPTRSHQQEPNKGLGGTSKEYFLESDLSSVFSQEALRFFSLFVLFLFFCTRIYIFNGSIDGGNLKNRTVSITLVETRSP